MNNDPTSPFEDATERTTPRRRRGGAWPAWLPYVGGVLASLATTLVVVLLVMDWTTAKGTLTVEVDQPGATVYLDGKKWNAETPGGMKPMKIPIREGRHEVHVSKAGYQAQTREIVFAKGRPQPIVQMRLKASKKTPR